MASLKARCCFNNRACNFINRFVLTSSEIWFFIKLAGVPGRALNLNEYCKKGSVLGVNARLQARSIKIGDNFLDVIDVIAEHIVFIGNTFKGFESKTDEKIEDIPLDALDELK